MATSEDLLAVPGFGFLPRTFHEQMQELTGSLGA